MQKPLRSQLQQKAVTTQGLKTPREEESVPWVLWESEPVEGYPVALEQCQHHRCGADAGKKYPTSLSKLLTQHSRNLFHRQTYIRTQNMRRNVFIIPFFITKNPEIILMFINISNDDVGKDHES